MSSKLAPSTIALYERYYKRYIDFCGIPKTYNDIINGLTKLSKFENKTYSPSVMRSFLASLAHFIENKKICDDINNQIKEINMLTTEKMMDCKYNDGEIHLDYEELKKKIENEISKCDYINRNMLMMSLITFFVRRVEDYSLMKLCNGDTPNDKEYNYYQPHKKLFTFNNYKTAKNYGVQVYSVPKYLNNVITRYIEDNDVKNGDRFFDIKPNSLTQSIKTCLNNLGYNRCNNNSIRHAYVNYLNGLNITLSQRNKFAEQMGHSYLMNKMYEKRDI